MKENARSFSKAADKDILLRNMEDLKKNRLSYSDESTELEQKQKKIYDLEMANKMKDEQFLEMKKNN